MTVQQSSITAYNEEVRSGNIPKSNRIILDCLYTADAMSNRMIACATGLETSTVSARVNGLMKSGLVIEAYYDFCRAPVKWKPKRVRFVQIAWPQGQMGMGT